MVHDHIEQQIECWKKQQETKRLTKVSNRVPTSFSAFPMCIGSNSVCLRSNSPQKSLKSKKLTIYKNVECPTQVTAQILASITTFHKPGFDRRFGFITFSRFRICPICPHLTSFTFIFDGSKVFSPLIFRPQVVFFHFWLIFFPSSFFWILPLFPDCSIILPAWHNPHAVALILVFPPSE